MAYDERCDVYSLALILWEILNLQKPFGKATMKDLEQRVWDDTARNRPEILVVASSDNDERQQVSSFLSMPKSGWTASLKSLVENSWAHNQNDRPTMEELESKLKVEATRYVNAIRQLHGQHSTDFLNSKRLTHDGRRSTFVYKSFIDEAKSRDSHPKRNGLREWISGFGSAHS